MDVIFASVESFPLSVHVIHHGSQGTDCEATASEVADNLSKELNKLEFSYRLLARTWKKVET